MNALSLRVSNGTILGLLITALMRAIPRPAHRCAVGFHVTRMTFNAIAFAVLLATLGAALMVSGMGAATMSLLGQLEPMTLRRSAIEQVGLQA